MLVSSFFRNPRSSYFEIDGSTPDFEITLSPNKVEVVHHAARELINCETSWRKFFSSDRADCDRD